MTAHRLLGAALLVGAYAPLHRLLDPAVAGPAGAATRDAAEAAWNAGLYGTLLVAGLAIVLARLVPGDGVLALPRRAVDALSRPRAAPFALAMGGLAAMLSAGVARFVFDGAPSSVDELAQLLHARALTGGALVLPTPGSAAAWVIQNGLLVEGGWVAIYPPLHTLLLAAGLAAGASWLVGPAAVGIATAASTAAFERLLGRRVGRAAATLLAITPFWLLLGATHLSHATAAAGLALVLWTALRAREGGPGWAAACGAAVGVAVCARPWVGLVGSIALMAGAWLVGPGRPTGRTLVVRTSALVAGGSPFTALLLWWNARLFGRPLSLGYSAAFGPAHGLGLHVDPWGNRYGALEAIAYTGADLVQLGAHLLESPLPALAVVGAGLLVATRTTGAGRSDPARPPAVLLLWVAAAVAANALYWHHGVHMGPRMLYESTPAWVGLFAFGAAELGRAGGARLRGFGAWLVILSLAGAAALAPMAVGARSATAVSPPEPDSASEAPLLVFAHGSWASRSAARLAAAGMRRDSIETALRRNDVCAVDRYARWRAAGAVDASPPLDFEPLPGSPPHLQVRLLSPGNPVRIDPGVVPDAACAREAAADRFGITELELLAWLAPPLPGSALAVARDLGPTENALVRSARPGPTFVLLPGVDGVGWQLLDYDDGMELLWRGAAGATSEPRTP